MNLRFLLACTLLCAPMIQSEEKKERKEKKEFAKTAAKALGSGALMTAFGYAGWLKTHAALQSGSVFRPKDAFTRDYVDKNYKFMIEEVFSSIAAWTVCGIWLRTTLRHTGELLKMMGEEPGKQ